MIVFDEIGGGPSLSVGNTWSSVYLTVRPDLGPPYPTVRYMSLTVGAEFENRPPYLKTLLAKKCQILYKIHVCSHFCYKIHSIQVMQGSKFKFFSSWTRKNDFIRKLLDASMRSKILRDEVRAKRKFFHI